ALSKTLFRRWIQRATLKRLGGLTDRNVDEGIQGSKTMIDSTPIQGEIYDRWLDHLNTYPPYSSSKWFQGYTKEELHRRARPSGKLVHPLYLGGQDLFGSIQTLFATEQIPNATFAQVALFVDVDQKGPRIDPYREISSLHYQLLARPKTPQTLVICIKNVIGHVAVLSNVPGVFGIDTETVSVAIVHH
ncbi:hypothetical protein PSHT_07991, partial [Puccinia striiformis]